MSFAGTPPPSLLRSVTKSSRVKLAKCGADTPDKRHSKKDKNFNIKRGFCSNDKRSDLNMSTTSELDFDQYLTSRPRIAANLLNRVQRQNFSFRSPGSRRPLSVYGRHNSVERDTSKYTAPKEPGSFNRGSGIKASVSMCSLKQGRPGDNSVSHRPGAGVSNLGSRWKDRWNRKSAAGSGSGEPGKKSKFAKIAKTFKLTVHHPRKIAVQNAPQIPEIKTQDEVKITMKKLTDNGLRPTLINVLRNADARAIFHAFLKKEHSEENCDFWFQTEEYKKKPCVSVAERICRTYIGEDAPFEVNLSHETKEWTRQQMKNPDSTLFDRAQFEIFHLMQTDPFVRFLTSAI